MPSVLSAGPVGSDLCGIFSTKAVVEELDGVDIDFLVDTGSAVSVLPKSFKFANATGTSSTSLIAANGSAVETYGNRRFQFTLCQLSRTFTWDFFIANVTRPILGADFFTFFNLLVDCSLSCLVEKDNLVSSLFSSDGIGLIKDNVLEFVKAYTPHVLTRQDASSMPCLSEHVIQTINCAPVRDRRRELSQERRLSAEKEFLELESQGIIRRSSSPWASALQIVVKKDGSLRCCGDYRRVNKVTVPDAYPMPLLSDILHRFSGCTVFSTLDLAKAYHQIPMETASIEKTAIITPFGLFEYLKMPFGLRNAAQTFQRHIDMVLKELPFVAAYIDDIIVFSVDHQQHQKHLAMVLKRLHEHNLQVKLAKCHFFVQQATFLGHLVSKDGILPLPDRLEAIKNFPRPITVTQLRSFLGMVNFCRKFIKGLSGKLAPLTRLAVGKKRAKIDWSSEADNSFVMLRQNLSNIKALHCPDSNLPITLTTDASNVAIGAVLCQVEGDSSKPIEFFSHKLNSAQTRYSTFDRELLSVFLAVKHFEHIVISRKTIVYTDHKPLLYALEMKQPSPRQQRQISYLSQFDLQFFHVAGADNVVADALSRVEINDIEFDSEFSRETLVSNPPSAEDIKSFHKIPTFRQGIYFDYSLRGTARPVLGKKFRMDLFRNIHEVTHAGFKATYEQIKNRVIWPFMRKDIKRWCEACLTCQASKITRHIKPPILHFPTGSRFDTVHIDIVGPLPPSRGYSYILTMIDRKTRWPEAFPLRNITAQTVADIFVTNWVSRFGVPKHVITDQGRQFESSLFQELLKRLGTKRLRTTAYHPQTNGLVERFHRTLKSSLRALANVSDWTGSLPLVLLGWRNIPSSRHGASPSQMLFGSNTTLVDDIFLGEDILEDRHSIVVRDHFRKLDTRPFTRSMVPIFIPKSLLEAKFVWVIRESPNSLEARYEGPYKLVKLDTAGNTAIVLIDGVEKRINLCKLKPSMHLEDKNDEICFMRVKKIVAEPVVTKVKKSVTFGVWNKVKCIGKDRVILVKF